MKLLLQVFVVIESFVIFLGQTSSSVGPSEIISPSESKNGSTVGIVVGIIVPVVVIIGIVLLLLLLKKRKNK